MRGIAFANAIKKSQSNMTIPKINNPVPTPTAAAANDCGTIVKLAQLRTARTAIPATKGARPVTRKKKIKAKGKKTNPVPYKH
ncbi:hypothetical protein, partial [Streptococcus pluranimalium]